MNLTLFEAELKKCWPKPMRAGFLVAVSGGVDSMLLLHNLLKLGLKPQVAHVNYGLREAESEADEALVKAFCETHQLKFHLKKINEAKPKSGLQAWARALRYDFFAQIQKEENLPFLFTAHHLEDQLETFVMNLSKAAGLDGLTGIDGHERNIIRPFLNFTKTEIYAMAESENLSYREDQSNQKQDYTRNMIRQEISPKLADLRPDFWPNFAQSLQFLKSAKHYIGTQIDLTKKEISLENPKYALVLVKALFADLSAFEQYHILKDYGFVKPEEIAKISLASTGSVFSSEKYELLVDRSELFLRMKSPKNGVNDEVIMHEMQEVLFHQQKFRYELSNQQNTDAYWVFDAEKVRFPLKLRTKISGDFFCPIGMNGKKMLSKYYKDKKINNFEKKDVVLLCDNKQILGIINYQQDKRCLIDDTTSQYINLYLDKI
jgi:tRNA(Ile)-lysidine synthase